MNIVVGTFDIRGLLNTYADGFRALGHKVITVARNRNKYFNDSKYDIDLAVYDKETNEFKTGQVENETVTKLISENDIFFFQWGGESLYPGNYEFPLLKKYGKKIISVFNGDDVRHHSAFDSWSGIPSLSLRRYCMTDPLLKALRNIRMGEAYSDLLLSLPNQSGLGIRPYMNMFIPLQLQKYKFNVPQRDIPVIVHATSDVEAAGTAKIVSTLAKLRLDGVQFTFKLLTNVQNKNVLEELTNADIAIDQLNNPRYGIFTIEAMASGCAVASGNNEDYDVEPYPFNRPIWNIDSDNIYEQLKQLILDKDLRIKLAEISREYVNYYHDHFKITENILTMMKEPLKYYDHYPNYFAKNFTLSKAESIPDDIKNLTFDIIKEWGLPNDVSALSLVERGLMRIENQEELQLIKHWPEDIRDKVKLNNYNPNNYLAGKEIPDYLLSNYQSKMDKVKISVCVPTYNRQQYLLDALKSAVEQDYDDYEIIVVDDGSDSGNASEIIKSLHSEKIKYYYKVHEGISATRNYAIDKTNGRYIIWLADDDLLQPGALKIYADEIDNNPDVDLFYCKVNVINKNKETINHISPRDWYGKKDELLSALVVGTPFPDVGCAIKKTLYKQLGGYNTAFKRAEDYELWSRLVTAEKYEVKLINSELYKYRIHGENITGFINEKTDYSYESEILNTIINKVPLPKLFKELDWINDNNNSEAKALYMLAVKYVQYNNFSKAKELIEKCYCISPETAMSNKQIYDTVMNAEIPGPKNKEERKELEQKTPMDEIEELIEAGSTEKAKLLLIEILEKDNANVDALNNLAVIEIMEKNYSIAVELLSNVLSLDAQNDVAIGNLQYLNQILGKD